MAKNLNRIPLFHAGNSKCQFVLYFPFHKFFKLYDLNLDFSFLFFSNLLHVGIIVKNIEFIF